MRRIAVFSLPALAAICVLFACFYGIGSYPLLDNNEGMYASIARNMAHGGDLVVPRLNGMPYFEKPPIFYWLTALSLHVFGDSESAARLVPSLSLLITIAACAFFLGRRLDRQTGAFAAFILSSCMWLAIARMIYFDMLLTCFITLALLATYQWYEKRERLWLVLAYALTALAVMTKGVLALVLVGGTGLCFLIAEGQLKNLWCKTFDPLGIIVFLAITVPWHLQASLTDPNFAWFYFINEQLRFFNLREPHDYYTGPVWYYLPRVFLFLFPWSVCLPLLAQRNPSQDISERRLEKFLWCWFGWMLLFFSLSTAKANYYIMPGLPALAMLLACRISALRNAGRKRLLNILLAASTAGIVLVALGLSMLCADHVYFQPYCSVITPKMVELTAVLAMVGGVVFWFAATTRAGIAVLACSVFLTVPLFVKGVRAGDQEISQRKVAYYLAKHEPQEPVALYRDFEDFSALAFYLGPQIMIVDSDSKDLLYGYKRYGDDNVHFATLDKWLEWSSESPVPTRILMSSIYLRDFRKRMEQSPYAATLHMGVKHFTRMSMVTLSTQPVDPNPSVDQKGLQSDGK